MHGSTRIFLLSATFMAVSMVGPAASAQSSVVGEWSATMSWPIAASHAALLSNGRVLLWTDTPGVTPRIWDPSTGAVTNATNVNGTLVGSAHVQLATGQIMIAGGRDASGNGLHDCGRYDASSSTWTQLPYLLQPRDEPSLILDGDGRALAFAGARQPLVPCDVVEYFLLNGTTWTAMNAVQASARTPWVFVLSGGDVLMAGPESQTRRLDVDADSWQAVSSMQAGNRDGGAAVLVPGTADRILVTGGRNPGVASCEILDLPSTTSWVYTNPMTRARRHHQATLLADGTVLVTGGTLVDDALAYAVLATERWQPAAGTWTTLASMTTPRRRGSIALLLPDARVLCAGGGDGTPGSELHADAQVFSPPYLYLGPRPTITAAPASVLFGTSFALDSPEAAGIDRIWFVRAGTSARGFNGDQRAVSLSFTAAAGRLTVSAPVDSNLAPPGTWMAFLVNHAGTPSVARLVQLQRRVQVPAPPDITSMPPVSAVVNAPFTYIPSANGSTPMTWTLISSPAWLQVSPSTGAVAGVPPMTGQYMIRLRATNTLGFDEQQWTLAVNASAAVRTVSPLGATWRYFKGTTNPPSNWATVGFADGSWLTGPSGFGFGDNDDATVLSDMQNNYTTVFTRYTFDHYNVGTVSKVSILYEYDDGLAVYLNGTRILAQNAPATITNTSQATSTHEATLNLIRADFTSAATRALLVNGANVVAAVGLNSSISNADMTLKVVLELTGGTTTPVDVGGAPPETAALERVGPNPFTSEARLHFRLVQGGQATLRLYDPAGRLVRAMHAPGLAPGAHDFTWDGTDATGAALPAGVYLYRLEAPGLDRRGKLTRAR